MKLEIDQINLSNFSKKFILISLDCLAIIFAIIFSYSIRLDTIYNPFDIHYSVYLIFVSVIIFNFYFNNIYQILISFFDNTSIVKIIRVLIISQIILIVINIIYYKFIFFPRSISIIAPIISGILFLTVRVVLNYLINLKKNSFKSNYKNKIVIYGLNEDSINFFKYLKNYPQYGKVVACIETKERFKRREISGVKIYKKKNFDHVISHHKITELIISNNSLSKKELDSLYFKFENKNIRIKNLNSLKKRFNILNKSLEVVPDFFDIIGRSKISVEKKILVKKIKNKKILVTGGAGSIGSELCIEILKNNPKMLFILDNSEINLFNLSRKINTHKFKNKKNFKFILGDCSDLNFLKLEFKNDKIDELYHAAAYKHLELGEKNTYSSIKNNVIGTKIVLEFCLLKKIENFTFISSDKAVNPRSVLGYTKKIGEFLVHHYSKSRMANSKMKFTVVRFGNVIGSSGSVIPIFFQQIKENKPLTVTDRNVKRYFMTIKEAVQLVINSSYLNKEKFNIYALDMGKQIKIFDIARKIIRLSGYTIRDKNNKFGDIPIIITGLKKGEKLHEEISLGKNLKITKNSKIMLCDEIVNKSSEIGKIFRKNFIPYTYDKKFLEKILK